MKTNFPKQWVTVHSDASFKEGFATIAVWIRWDAGSFKFSKVCPENIKTINEAELYGLVHGAYTALIKYPQAKGFYLRTDSQHAISILLNPLKGVVENVERRLKSAYLNTIKDLPVNIKHIKGHTKSSITKFYVNNWCDREAGKLRREKEKKVYVG